MTMFAGTLQAVKYALRRSFGSQTDPGQFQNAIRSFLPLPADRNLFPTGFVVNTLKNHSFAEGSIERFQRERWREGGLFPIRPWRCTGLLPVKGNHLRCRRMHTADFRKHCRLEAAQILPAQDSRYAGREQSLVKKQFLRKSPDGLTTLCKKTRSMSKHRTCCAFLNADGTSRMLNARMAIAPPPENNDENGHRLLIQGEKMSPAISLAEQPRSCRWVVSPGPQHPPRRIRSKGRG